MVPPQSRSGLVATPAIAAVGLVKRCREGQGLLLERLPPIRRMHQRSAVLEDVFLRLTGRGLQD